MRSRLVYLLTAGLAASLAISPVLAAEGLPWAGVAWAAPSPSNHEDPPDGDSADPGDDSADDSATDDSMDDSTDDSAADDSMDDSTDDSADDSADQSADGGSSDRDAPPAAGRRDGSTGSSPPSGSASGSSSNCAPPETDRAPAPQLGEDPQTYEAGEAGTVEVERLSDTELRIVEATANDGWTADVTAASGPRVKVRFSRPNESPSRVRFAASMDQAGQELHLRVTTCG